MKWLADLVIPEWLRDLAIAVVVLTLLYAGGKWWLHDHDTAVGKAAVLAYQKTEVKVAEKIVERQVLVKGEVQIKYVDRIKKIYIKGDEIEKIIPQYVQPADDVRYAVNTGFVRVIDAAWQGRSPGPAVDSDREPAGVPLSSITSTEAGNATSCLVWRKIAIGWREFYAGQQKAINGKTGRWYVPEDQSEAALAPPGLDATLAVSAEPAAIGAP